MAPFAAVARYDAAVVPSNRHNRRRIAERSKGTMSTGGPTSLPTRLLQSVGRTAYAQPALIQQIACDRSWSLGRRIPLRNGGPDRATRRCDRMRSFSGCRALAPATIRTFRLLGGRARAA